MTFPLEVYTLSFEWNNIRHTLRLKQYPKILSSVTSEPTTPEICPHQAHICTHQRLSRK